MDVRVVGLHHSHRGIPVVACAPSQQQFHPGGVVSRFLLALFLASVASNVSLSKAASQGTVGKTSSGSFTITLVIPPRLSVQTLSVEPDAVPEANGETTTTETATTSDTTTVTVVTAKQVLSKVQALQAAEATAQTAETTTTGQSSSNAAGDPLPEAPAEIIPTNTLQRKLCIQGSGMSHYSLQASGSRNDQRMVLSSESGSEVPYQVVMTDQSSQAPINLQTAKTLSLDRQSDCSTSPVVSINLSNSARNNLQDNRYYGAAQVTVAAE